MKTYFDRIKITGFRRLCNIDLELRQLTVLVGANGVGKTSFLDVMSLLAASASSHLSAFISDMGGLPNLITHDRFGGISIGLSMKVGEDIPLVYDLSLVPSGLAYSIEDESLTQHRDPTTPQPLKYIDSHSGNIRYFEKGNLVRPTWEHNPLESSLSQVPKMYKEPELFRHVLGSSTFYHVLDVSPRSPARLPQQMRPAGLPGQQGEDLVSCLYYLRETDRDRFEAIEDTLMAAFPGFERLDFPPVAAGTISMTWKDKNFSKPIYAHQLSEGTLRFLWLVTLLQSPNLPTVTLIDEPEVSLHPEMLPVLAGLMREASEKTQLIVATHSDRFVRFLEPSELVVMDIGEKGEATMTWADTLDINEWLAEYSLDELWRMGRLGGRS